MTAADDRSQSSAPEGGLSASRLSGEAALVLARVWARLPCPAVISIKRIGDLRLQPDRIALVDELDREQVEDLAWFRLSRSSEQAWLGVSLNVCRGLIRAVLGDATPWLVRPLGLAEKGMMAALVLAALRSLGLAGWATVAPGEGQPCVQGRQVLIEGTIQGAAEIDGRALLLGPLAMVADGIDLDPAAIPSDDTGAEGVLELGRTEVPAADLAAAVPGDALVFDGTPGLVPGAAWPVRLLVGRSRVSARLEPDSRLVVEGSWSPMEEETAAFRNQNPGWKPAAPASPETSDPSRTTVEAVAELGRISLRSDELVRLAREGSLKLGPRPGDGVSLRVGDQLWATGEVVTLGEQLGVRIVHRHG